MNHLIKLVTAQHYRIFLSKIRTTFSMYMYCIISWITLNSTDVIYYILQKKKKPPEFKKCTTWRLFRGKMKEVTWAVVTWALVYMSVNTWVFTWRHTTKPAQWKVFLFLKEHPLQESSICRGKGHLGVYSKPTWSRLSKRLIILDSKLI